MIKKIDMITSYRNISYEIDKLQTLYYKIDVHVKIDLDGSMVTQTDTITYKLSFIHFQYNFPSVQGHALMHV